jgi:hypothetical protein
MLLWGPAGAVALLMLWFRAPLRVWYKPDNFDREPIKWMTNQGAHAALGLALALLVSWVGWATQGEYPIRWEIWAVCVLLVLVFELGVQGWHRWDTVHDAAFTAGWGAGCPLLVFHETDAGGLGITGNGALAVALLIGALLHLACRYWRSARSPAPGRPRGRCRRR